MLCLKSDLMRSLDGKDNTIFPDSDLFNPYTPDANQRSQFQLPLSIKDSATDTHGQLTAKFLSDIFDYVEVGSGANQKVVDTQGTPHLSEDLIGKITPKFKRECINGRSVSCFLCPSLPSEFLARAYSLDEAIDEAIKFFEDCDGEICSFFAAFLKDLARDFYDKGLDRTSLDTSIALVFGNKTTIGQVCSFARGLDDGAVDDIPGFCCLDAPYQAPDWGEKVRNTVE